MSEEQAVVEQDAQVDDLDSLLGEFEEGQPQAAPQEATAPDNKVEEIQAWVEQQKANEIQKETQNDIASAVSTIKEGLSELPFQLPEKFIRGLLLDKAESDPRFVNAFQQRRENPEAWGKILGAVQREVISDFSAQPDKQATDSHNSVIAAVRSASTKSAPQESVNWGQLSGAEFEEAKRKLARG